MFNTRYLALIVCNTTVSYLLRKKIHAYNLLVEYYHNVERKLLSYTRLYLIQIDSRNLIILDVNRVSFCLYKAQMRCRNRSCKKRFRSAGLLRFIWIALNISCTGNQRSDY